MLRRCGALKLCDSISACEGVIVLSVPGPGFIAWQVLQLRPWVYCSFRKVLRPAEGLPPAKVAGRVRSNCSLGFGEKLSVLMKSRKAFMSAVESWLPPNKLLNAGLKAVKSARSPRQWSGSRLLRPLSVCVVIGPFIGCMLNCVGVRKTETNAVTVCMEPPGLPKSQ